MPRIEGAAGAAFWVYYGEVNQDSDGPVEFCWAVPQDQAGQLAASMPGLTLRTESAHQDACVHLDQDATQAQGQAVSDSALAWVAGQQRQPSDLGLRITLLTTAAPVTDVGRRGGSDFALPLRDRAGAA